MNQLFGLQHRRSENYHLQQHIPKSLVLHNFLHLTSNILHLTSYILKMLGLQPSDISPQPSYIVSLVPCRRRCWTW